MCVCRNSPVQLLNGGRGDDIVRHKCRWITIIKTVFNPSSQKKYSQYWQRVELMFECHWVHSLHLLWIYTRGIGPSSWCHFFRWGVHVGIILQSVLEVFDLIDLYWCYLFGVAEACEDLLRKLVRTGVCQMLWEGQWGHRVYATGLNSGRIDVQHTDDVMTPVLVMPLFQLRVWGRNGKHQDAFLWWYGAAGESGSSCCFLSFPANVLSSRLRNVLCMHFIRDEILPFFYFKNFVCTKVWLLDLSPTFNFSSNSFGKNIFFFCYKILEWIH